jgi:septation ring formation regulator EzrA
MLDNATLEKHLKKFQVVANIWSLAIGLVTAIGVCYGFIYKTNTKLDNHTKQIDGIEMKLGSIEESITNTAVYQGASKEQIKALENQVTDVKKSQDRIEDKLDKLIMQRK